MNMRAIDHTPFIQFAGEPASLDLGSMPGLAWVPIANLRIDPAYQREVLRNGARNIGKIARNFDWSLFGVVVIANIGDNLFAIVDGQHRTIAAALRGVVEVPCIIIEADPKKQARAFAAINGSITAISPLAIFHAQVAAGEKDPVELVSLCRDSGVEICRYPIPASHMRRGQTLALRALQDAFKNYGPETLSLALRFILASKNESAGVVKAPLVKAVCHILDADKDLMRHKTRLVQMAQQIDLLQILSDSELDAKRQKRPAHVVLSLKLFSAVEGVYS